MDGRPVGVLREVVEKKGERVGGGPVRCHKETEKREGNVEDARVIRIIVSVVSKELLTA